MKLLAFVFLASTIAVAISDPISKIREEDAVQTKRAADVSVQKTFKVEGKFYIFINQKKSFDQARSVCNELGGDLASILSYKEFDGIISKLELISKKLVWVGAKLRGSDLMNDWEWLTGEPLPIKFRKWRRNDDGTIREPDLLTHNCALIAFQENLNNEPHLATVPCTGSPRNFLCQI